MFVKTFFSVLIVVCGFVVVESAVMAEQVATEGGRVFISGPSVAQFFRSPQFVFDPKGNAFVAKIKGKSNKEKSQRSVPVPPADPEPHEAH